MLRPVPTYETNTIPLHFLLQSFWYLSIFCNRLYSEDIHCELGWRTFCCIYSVALSLLFCCLSFACTGQYVTSLYFVPLCKMNPQTYTIDTGPSERIGKWGLKYGFCNKSFRKDETLTSWTLVEHFFQHIYHQN